MALTTRESSRGLSVNVMGSRWESDLARPIMFLNTGLSLALKLMRGGNGLTRLVQAETNGPGIQSHHLRQ